MKRQRDAMRWLVKLFLVAQLLLLVVSIAGQTRSDKQEQPSPPEVRITRVPHKGGGPDMVEAIGGAVSGVDPSAYRVVIFALGGATWYVQPYTTSPYTTIAADGRWENDTHLGSQYAALLVKPSFKPLDTAATLPAVGGDVVAITRVPAKEH